jgi:hypothetical protein
LIDIVKFCESRFNRGPASEWKHSDFGELSREILLDTDTAISPNTLKRIFGKISVEDDYFPQQATIDALKIYGGYIPPEADQPTHAASLLEISQLAGAQKTDPGKNKYAVFFSRHKKLLIISIILITGFVLLILKISKPENVVSGKITQSGIEGLLPATVFFDLQLPDTKDSLFIDFGDKSSLLNVKPGQKNAAHNYIFPGVFRVSLKTRQTILSTINVSIRSDRWIGLAYPPQGTLPYHYLETPAVKTGNDSLFHIGNSQLFEMGLDTIGLFYTQLCNFTPVNYAGEDFIFEASFKNVIPAKGLSCKGTQFQISGISGFIRFKLVNSGCSYRVINVLSEQMFDGRIINLSQFVVDLEKWNSVRLVNKNKQVELYVNGKLLFTGKYEISLGKIQGLFLEFEGNGYIKDCDLKTLDGKLLYHF